MEPNLMRNHVEPSLNTDLWFWGTIFLFDSDVIQRLDELVVNKKFLWGMVVNCWVLLLMKLGMFWDSGTNIVDQIETVIYVLT